MSKRNSLMEKISLTIVDGKKMDAYVARPEMTTMGGIIVLQEAFGVNHHVKDITKRLADAGYLAIAPEIYHRTAPAGFTCGYQDFQQVTDHFNAITESGIREDIQVCFDWLKAEGVKNVASIGYCLGGRVSFIANAHVNLACAISYYGGRIVPTALHLAQFQKSPLLFFWGNLDLHIPNEQIQILNLELGKANKKFTCVQISDAEHGFFCDERPSYNPVAARESWALCLQFLKEHCPTS